MKRILAALLVLTPHLLLARPPAGELEDRLDELAERVRLGRYAEALDLGSRVEEQAAAAGDRPALVLARTAIGDAHQGLGNLDAALASFRAALRLARESGELPAIAETLLRIGRIHARQGRLPAAAETLRRALTAATEIDARAQMRDAELALAETYAAMGGFRQAYEAARRHGKLALEMAEAESGEVVAELEARIAADREGRELEVSRLRRELDERRRSTAAQTVRTRALAGVSIAAGIALLALAWNRHRLKRHGSRELAGKTLELERATAEGGETAAELARTAAELERTTDELGEKTAELERTADLLDRTAAALERKSAAFDDDAAALDRTAAELDEFRRRYRRDVSELQRCNAASEFRAAEMERSLSTVSQHLKILLVSIRGALGTLEEEAAAGGAGEPSGEMERARLAVGEVVRLLDRLLQLLLVGRMVHAPETASLSELAFEAVGQVADLAAGRAVEIVIAPDMPPVVGDREQLLCVLRQLLDNGARFLGRQPEPRLEVGWRRGRDGEPPVFYVRDNGAGIDPRDHGKAFTLFERLDAEPRGDGIGLALVRRIVEAHDGRVWIESEGGGHGTTVCFTLGATDRPGRSGQAV